MKIECAHDAMVALRKLKPHPGNPNKHPPEQIRLLSKIISSQGWRLPIVVSNRSGFIVAGHGRLLAAQALRLKEAPVDYQEFGSEAEEIAHLIADNRIAELAEMDRAALRELAEQIDSGAFDMELTGFDPAALEELMTAAPPESDVDAEPQIDKAAELAKKWGVKRGQIWELGAHRLMCGDSTDQENVKALVNGEGVQLSLTDPPYSVNYSISFSKAEGKKDAGIQKEYQEASDATDLLGGFLSNMPAGLLVMTFPVDRHLFALADQLRASGFVSIRELVWSKSSATFHPGQTYQQKHEPILICRRKGTRYPSTIPSDANTVLECDRTSAHEDHPTEKPLELWKRLLDWHSTSSTTVYEPFSGTGTTIIACENLRRHCLAMEISEAYTAVAIQRWLDATGKTPRLLNGR